MKKTLTLTSAALIASGAFAGAATAGNLAEPMVEPVMTAPVPAPNLGGDWTGFYTGLQLGYADVDGDGALGDGDNGSYGFHAGYDYDFGRFVLGGELDYDKTDIDLSGGAEVDSVARAKIKGGYDLGNTLLYATGGYARADTSVGDEDGAFYGIGMNYKVTEQYTVGAELLQHEFDDVGNTGLDADATTFNIRGSYRF